ncbi:MAG: DUF3034 family protein [Opitutales bacterium]|nr:DUF3034 family protein [Opitutales bacterium]
MKINTLLTFSALFAATSLTYAAENSAAAKSAENPASKASAPAKAEAPAQAKSENPAPAKAEKGAPLPLLTLDGVGGVVITPIAYLVNPGAEGTEVGLPSFGATYVNARQKNVESFGVTETLFTRLELGYNASRFGTGSLQSDVLKYAGVDIDRNDVWLHSLNARLNVIRENDFDTKYLPALTIGVHGKFNDGINEINENLGGLLSQIGYDRDYGVEFTATISKTFVIEGHPIILSLTGRASDASNLGYTGFSGKYEFSVEGNIVVGITDWLFAAFEYRQKINQYDDVSAGGRTLIGEESDWWTVGLAAIVTPHLTVTAGYGHLGTVLNTVENTAWALSAKYEF